jgi:hypothetical protein
MYLLVPTGGEQAEALYLPSFVTDFDCGITVGRVSPVPVAVSIDRYRRWLSGFLPFLFFRVSDSSNMI